MSISVKLNKKGIKKLQKELEMGVILSLVHWTYLMKFQTLNLMLEI